ncbi:hypothetical protein ACTHO0_28060 [Cytobacillus praedii]|uniref:hypothetical protein n=1 Tax=Cytobacillus praedii TaxID=1742358 RepID=UPI003F80329D
MAKMIQVPYKSDIVIPIETAQAVQENRQTSISLQALGLLVNLLSYPSTWELHKTELYKRYGKNKEESVKSAWNDLIAANYIIEFKYRSGKKWEYVYYFRKVPFSPEEKAEILDIAKNEYGEIWGLDFQVLKMETRKSRGNQKPLKKQDPLLNTNINNKNYIDDDKRTSPSEEVSSSHNNEAINLIISNFREATKNDLSDRSFKAIVRKVIDKYNQGKVSSFRDYLATSLANKINELELRRTKIKAKEQLRKHSQERIQERKLYLEEQPIKTNVPFYNWLEG